MDIVRERVMQHIKLAQILAAKYFNIPGASREEVLSEAQTALVKASMAYQEDKGPFTAFAGTVIRNALNSLYKKQLRQVQMIGKSLDETIHGATQFGTHIGNLGQNLADTKKDVVKEVSQGERRKTLSRALSSLKPQEVDLLINISKGMSFSEVGAKLGISKQAVHKMWARAIKKMQERLRN
jgi:RNA polymerase sigma factor (sigma-70 family)